jgi:SAM-dependent MidA family methyltransferase
MNSAANIIREEIERAGPISFSRFMELALYAPDVGYYERQREIGRRGDFYTSVSVGSLFGELLAFQFAQWLSNLRFATSDSEPTKASPSPAGQSRVQLLEAGAHDGRLAFDILTALQKYKAVFDRLEYWILEPSPKHQEWQKQTLGKFSDKVRWFNSWQSLPHSVSGIIFSNELLDAMPVNRFQWSAEKNCWFEMKVGWEQDRFIWQKGRASKRALHFTKAAELKKILPDGFITEVSPHAPNWWRDAASHLQHGKLLAIDYGLSDLGFFYPERKQGTLRGYSQHRIIDDVLLHPGEMDLTTHVDFTEVQRAGEAAGLHTEALITQTKFLTQIVEQIWKLPEEIKNWSSQKSRQFQTLTHPEHLGRSFRVLLQSK